MSRLSSREEAYEALQGIYRMMHKVGIPLSTITFGMMKIMKEWNISKTELASIRRRIIRELSYIIV